MLAGNLVVTVNSEVYARNVNSAASGYELR